MGTSSSVRGWPLVAGLAAALWVASPVAAAPPPLTPAPSAPLVLPAKKRALAARAGEKWIVAGRPGPRTARIARRFGARQLLRQTGIFAIPIRRARAFAASLRAAGGLTFAEPNRRIQRKAYPQDPLTPYQWYLGAVAADQTPPPVSASSPTLGIVDDQVDLTHPEWTGDPNIAVARPGPDTEGHGTATASVAGAPANGQGIVGVWPGMRIRSYAASDCASAVQGIDQAIRDNVSVINMSYGFEDPTLRACFAHFVATQFAFGEGIALVAAGGNEFQAGNYPSRPAVDPHVFSVAATAPDGGSPGFSNEGNYIDISAPGFDIVGAVPFGFDTDDGVADGYTVFDGTSFAAPIVSAAAAWIRDRRSSLDPGQVYDALRLSATDLGRRGWDRRFGFGLVNIGRALSQRVPSADPLEPNDDIEWIDGTRFATPDRPIFRATSRRTTLAARLDALEDPVDVYPVVMPRRSRLRLTLAPSYGDADLEAYASWAETVYGRLGRLASSTRAGSRTEAITLVNRLNRSRKVYVDAYVATNVNRPGVLDARYRLTIRRIRSR